MATSPAAKIEPIMALSLSHRSNLRLSEPRPRVAPFWRGSFVLKFDVGSSGDTPASPVGPGARSPKSAEVCVGQRVRPVGFTGCHFHTAVMPSAARFPQQPIPPPRPNA
jgi:hypothetical protein